MRFEMFQVDAFTDTLFAGNPAAVCILEEWPSDGLMQRIAEENNLSETAFVVPRGEYFDLRWFTPEQEVDLCGHATLASAFVLYEFLNYPDTCVVFQTQCGRLFVDRDGEYLSMDFPAWPHKPFAVTERVVRAFGGAVPLEMLASRRDFLAVFETEEQIRALRPDVAALAELDALCVIATAPGDRHDFVSRCFCPRAGVMEDPVTGSAHCTLIPFWSERLGKKRMRAYQASRRGGELLCDNLGERVAIAGKAVCFFRATVELDDTRLKD